MQVTTAVSPSKTRRLKSLENKNMNSYKENKDFNLGVSVGTYYGFLMGLVFSSLSVKVISLFFNAYFNAH